MADRRKFLKDTARAVVVLPLATRALANQASSTPAASRIATAKTSSAPVHLNVRDFGAKGDGATKDTLAVQQALDRCGVLGGGEVLIPAGEYLVGTITLRSNTILRIEEAATLKGSPDLADYPLTQVRWEGKWIKGYPALVTAVDAENITLTGQGKILGNTAIAGRVDRATGMRHPALLEFVHCRHIRVENLYTQQNDMWSIHPVYCEDVTFQNVTVHGGADGIDVDSCKHVVIDHCEFNTADDCISLKSGRGMEGNTIARPTEDVRISNCTFHDLHWACIGIGSETSAGIRNVHVEHCKCLSAKTFAIYIKSRPGRGAFLENIFMNDLEVSGAQMGFLRLNILDSGKQDEAPVPGTDGIPTIRNFQFRNIRVTDMPVLVEAVNIHPAKPLDGFVLENVSGTCRKGISLANMQHVSLKGISVTGFDGPLLSTVNVSGTGLQGATALPPTKVPDAITAKDPYVLR
ncbi:glycoside hydrolase family 28 protein [Terriglobus albidus]|uniref:Glycoside hydrolase family 28 protein n=1 Tax=Terriglobus albidus TaxID=1592106 RepID=A0A5B9ECB3_9BACT|nr:glycoside hydrolase family 28 protein [Terriglobus albidus]QEE28340.1 glycoside hydrolase family 28 protein [Terriglobus albidus]